MSNVGSIGNVANVGNEALPTVRGSWWVLASAWVLFALPVPFAGLLVGIPLAIWAFVRASLARRAGVVGAQKLWLWSVAASPVFYVIGLVLFWIACNLLFGTLSTTPISVQLPVR